MGYKESGTIDFFKKPGDLINQGSITLVYFFAKNHMVNIKKPNNSLNYWQPYLKIVIKLSAWIAGPVLLGAWLGKWLDRKYDTEPWLFLATVGLSFLISMFGLIKNTLSEFKKIDSSNNKSSLPDPKDQLHQ